MSELCSITLLIERTLQIIIITVLVDYKMWQQIGAVEGYHESVTLSSMYCTCKVAVVSNHLKQLGLQPTVHDFVL